MDTETAKTLLQSSDIALLKEEANKLLSFETDDARYEQQVLKLQILLWNRILVLQQQSGSTSTPSEQALTIASVGRVWIRMGETERAIGQLKKSLQLDPNAIEALQLLGVAFTDEGSYDDAIQAHEHAVQQIQVQNRPQAELASAFCQLASVYECKGEYTQALETLKKASALPSVDADDETMATVYGQIGTLHEKLGQYKEAVTALSKAHGAIFRCKGPAHPKAQELSFLMQMATELAGT